MLTKDQDLRSTVVDLLEDGYLTNDGKQPLDLFDDHSSAETYENNDSRHEGMSVVRSVDEITIENSLDVPLVPVPHNTMAF